MSDCARIDVVEMADKQLGSKRCSGGRKRATALKLTWWEWDTSGCAQTDVVEVADERLGLKRHSGGRKRAIVLKLTWWEWDTSGRAQIDAVGEGERVGVGHEWSGSN